MLYRLKCRDTGISSLWTVSEILMEINRDRSEDWTDYDRSDWREGLKEFTQFDLIKELPCARG
jgi:hypothetical protein